MTAKATVVVAKGVPHPAADLEVAVHLAGISELPHLKRLEVAHSYTVWQKEILP